MFLFILAICIVLSIMLFVKLDTQYVGYAAIPLAVAVVIGLVMFIGAAIGEFNRKETGGHTYTLQDVNTLDKAIEVCTEYQLRWGTPQDIANKCYPAGQNSTK